MTITNAWDETFPSNTRFSNNLAADQRRQSKDVREQLTDGNHRPINDINIEPGAIHIASDSDSEFPIYSAEGSTLKVAGWQASKRNFGAGVRLNHIHERRIKNDGVSRLGAGLFIFQELEPGSVYTFEARIVIRDPLSIANGAITTTASYYHDGGSVSRIDSADSQDDTLGTFIVIWDASTTFARLRVSNTSAGGAWNAVTVVRTIRVI